MANMGLSMQHGADFANKVWGGYYKGQENQRQQEQEARAAEQARRQQEEFDWRRQEQARQEQLRTGLQQAAAVPEMRDVTLDSGQVVKGLYLGDQELGRGDIRATQAALDEYNAGAGKRTADVYRGAGRPLEAMQYRAAELGLGEKEDTATAKKKGREYISRVSGALNAGVGGMANFLGESFSNDEGEFGQGAYKGVKSTFEPAGAGKFRKIRIDTGPDGQPVRTVVGEVTEDQVKDEFYFRAALGSRLAEGDSKGVLDYLKTHVKDKNDQRRLDLAEKRADLVANRQAAALKAQEDAIKGQPLGRTDKGEVVMRGGKGLVVIGDDGAATPYTPTKHGKLAQVQGLDATHKAGGVEASPVFLKAREDLYAEEPKPGSPKRGEWEAKERSFNTRWGVQSAGGGPKADPFAAENERVGARGGVKPAQNTAAPGVPLQQRVNPYGTEEAMLRRKDELQRIVGDQGNPIQTRRDAQAELNRNF